MFRVERHVNVVTVPFMSSGSGNVRVCECVCVCVCFCITDIAEAPYKLGFQGKLDNPLKLLLFAVYIY